MKIKKQDNKQTKQTMSYRISYWIGEYTNSIDIIYDTPEQFISGIMTLPVANQITGMSICNHIIYTPITLQIPTNLLISFTELNHLHIQDANMSELPDIPQSVCVLEVENTNITTLDYKLPIGLLELEVQRNFQLNKLPPQLPPTLIKFIAVEQELSVMNVPDSLLELYIYNSNVSRLNFNSCQSNINYMSFDNNYTPYTRQIEDDRVPYPLCRGQMKDIIKFKLDLIRKKNKDMDTRFINYIHHIKTRVINHIQSKTETENNKNIPFIETVFVLGSNYPFRICEFVINSNSW